MYPMSMPGPRSALRLRGRAIGAWDTQQADADADADAEKNSGATACRCQLLGYLDHATSEQLRGQRPSGFGWLAARAHAIAVLLAAAAARPSTAANQAPRRPAPSPRRR